MFSLSGAASRRMQATIFVVVTLLLVFITMPFICSFPFAYVAPPMSASTLPGLGGCWPGSLAPFQGPYLRVTSNPLDMQKKNFNTVFYTGNLLRFPIENEMGNFPFMGKIWNRKFLFWGDFRFLLGKKVYFPFISQYWEYFVNVCQVISKAGNNMGTFPKSFPTG